MALLQSMAELEARLLVLDRQIEQLALQAADPARHQLLQTLPGFGPITAAKLIAYLPEELLQAGSTIRGQSVNRGRFQFLLSASSK